jgi:photosystem II stability/assembly factor-like uncharacterized protein
MHQFQVLAFLLFFQSFISCQQAQEKAVPMATADLQFISTNQQDIGKPKVPATNIIFQSFDGGHTWQDISAGLPSDRQVYSLFAQNDEVFVSNENGIYRSKITSETPVWQKEYLLNSAVYGIFPGHSGLYALDKYNSFLQNISKDIWVPVFSGLKGQYLRNVLETHDKTILVGTEEGIFKSTDQGKTWKHVYNDGWVIRMVESEGVLICTNEHGILRSTDGGEHWDVVVSEGGVGIEAEVIKGGFAAITYNTESKTRRVRISMDAGKNWQAIDAGLPPTADIASIKQMGEYFFCGHPDGIFRSSDQGKTWELILSTIEKKVFNVSILGGVIYAMPRAGGC